jgi:hypothetical protein
MKSLDLWRCRKELSLREASALMIDLDPSELGGYRSGEDGNSYQAALALLLDAVDQGLLVARTQPHKCQPSRESEPAEGTFDYVEPEFATEDYIKASLVHFWVPCPCKTEARVQVADLKDFLASNGLKPFFFRDEPTETERQMNAFFLDSPSSEAASAAAKSLLALNSLPDSGSQLPSGPDEPAYLRNGKRRSLKLVAAIAAWVAVSANPQLTKGRSPKNALLDWLEEHASEYGLARPDGSLITNAIDYIATVANWSPKGGAPKTFPRR